MPATTRCVVVASDFDDSAGYFTVRVTDASRGAVEVLANDWGVDGAVEARVQCTGSLLALSDAPARARVLVPTGPTNDRGEQEWELAVVAKGAAKKR